MKQNNTGFSFPYSFPVWMYYIRFYCIHLRENKIELIIKFIEKRSDFTVYFKKLKYFSIIRRRQLPTNERTCKQLN